MSTIYYQLHVSALHHILLSHTYAIGEFPLCPILLLHTCITPLCNTGTSMKLRNEIDPTISAYEPAWLVISMVLEHIDALGNSDVTITTVFLTDLNSYSLPSNLTIDI